MSIGYKCLQHKVVDLQHPENSKSCEMLSAKQAVASMLGAELWA